MDAQLIEKLDRRRFWAVVVETAGLLSLTIECLLYYFKAGDHPATMALFPGGPGLIVLAGGGIWYGTVWMRVRRDKQLKDALYNEMYIQNKYRYQRLALWVMIIACILSLVPGMKTVPTYPYMIVVEMILLAGLLTMKISWIIFNRK